MLKKNIILTLIPLFLLIFVILILVIKDAINPFNEHKFDQKLWLQLSKNDKIQERGKMASDIISNQIKHNMSKVQVTDLIGIPTRTSNKSIDAGGNKFKGKSTLVYYIGHASSMGYDDAFMYIHLNKQDQVISSEINGY
ncbi:MAG: hypothetical protein COA79_17430 [Planctomycetota bacterium]|nr:MAG: hypothetical protein COA79_17430 [Planctomycetota bacterium]